MIVVLMLFWFVGLFLSIKKPTFFVVYFILASTRFLGFIDPATFIINGVELGYFGLNIVTLLGSFSFTKWYMVSKKATLFISLIIVMLIYGVLKPIFDGNSTIFQSLMASKEIWFYFLFFYLVVHRKIIDLSKLIMLIKWGGIYLSLTYIIGAFMPIILPPYYFEDEIVRVYYPTYISLALLFYAADIKVFKWKIINHLLPILLLLIGLIIAGYASLTIMSTIGLIVYLFIYDKKSQLNKISTIGLAVLSALLIFSVILIREDTYNMISRGLDDIISGNDTSLSSRAFYNEFRWETINKQKEFGYGFIHESAEIMKSMDTSDTNRYMQRLAVIDSGYVDMLTKFGFIGTAIILFIYFKYTIIVGFMKKNKNPLSLAMSIFLAQYFFVNYTWSVFTFAHGIIPAVVALYIILYGKFKNDYSNKKIIISDKSRQYKIPK